MLPKLPESRCALKPHVHVSKHSVDTGQHIDRTAQQAAYLPVAAARHSRTSDLHSAKHASQSVSFNIGQLYLQNNAAAADSGIHCSPSRLQREPTEPSCHLLMTAGYWIGRLRDTLKYAVIACKVNRQQLNEPSWNQHNNHMQRGGCQP